MHELFVGFSAFWWSCLANEDIAILDLLRVRIDKTLHDLHNLMSWNRVFNLLALLSL